MRINQNNALTNCLQNLLSLSVAIQDSPVFSETYWLFSFRLEIGVQSVYEDIARDTNRGHTVKAVCENFNLAKDAGYKVK